MSDYENILNQIKGDYMALGGKKILTPKSDPTVNARVLDYSKRFSKMQLCFISDMHIGSVDFDMDNLLKNLKYASEQENALVFFLGDGMNAAIIGSKSDPYEDVLNPQQQIDLYTKIASLAKGNTVVPKFVQKLLNDNKIMLPNYASYKLPSGKFAVNNLAVMNEGNHESRITKSVGISPTKLIADAAGASEAFAPFFSSIELLLKKEGAKDDTVPFKIVTHHGTGNFKLDNMQKFMRNINNAHLYVMGHIHKHTVSGQRVKDLHVDAETGEMVEEYRKVTMMTLPASGGGTYGAGMSMAKLRHQTAVWAEVEPQKNPYAKSLSPTNTTHPEYEAVLSFFTPQLDTKNVLFDKSKRQTIKSIEEAAEAHLPQIVQNIENLTQSLSELEKQTALTIAENISVKSLKEPKGFKEYVKEKHSDLKESDYEIDKTEVEIESPISESNVENNDTIKEIESSEMERN